jgi:hypothetical protein
MWQFAVTHAYARFVARLIQKDALRQPDLPQGIEFNSKKL